MPRIARIVVPGLPHHVTQRGNYRAPIFFEPSDYRLYRSILAAACAKERVAVWAYCLMPNHVHLIMVPETKAGLARALAQAHRRYASIVNARAGRTGHLFQGRFGSVVMDEIHLMAAIRYVSLNPVRAKLVEQAQAWEWSSVRAHLAGVADGLVEPTPVLSRVENFVDLIASEAEGPAEGALRKAEIIGRPLGSPEFLANVGDFMGREVQPRKRGRKAQGSPGIPNPKR